MRVASVKQFKEYLQRLKFDSPSDLTRQLKRGLRAISNVFMKLHYKALLEEI
jgi:hypothetical protein